MGHNTAPFFDINGFDITSEELPTETTHLVVLKLDLGTVGGEDTITAWVNPQLGLGSEPPFTPGVNGVVATVGFVPFNRLGGIVRVEFSESSESSAQTYLDEIRFGTTWADVTPVAASVTPGDYDRNGSVGPEDYQLWKSTFGMTIGGDLRADGNGNDIVDAADYTVWRDHLGVGSGAAASANSVPEPGGRVLSALAGLGSVAASLRRATIRRRAEA